MNTERFDVVTVTLNPAVDRTITIPRFTVGAVNRAGAEHSLPGGKGVNVAASLARAGHRVAVTGFLGSENAAPFESFFAGLGIADRFIRVAGCTRVGIKIVDPELGQTTDINFAGPPAAPTERDALMRCVEALEAPWFVLAGSLPPGVDPGFYTTLIASLKARGARVMLDTSGEALRRAVAWDQEGSRIAETVCRFAEISVEGGHPSDARGPRHAVPPAEARALPHLIKPNLHELGELLGEMPDGPDQIVLAARRLIEAGIDQVVVSLGGDGALLVSAAEAVRVRPPPIAVHSTVGAGDAMVAGLVSAQLRGLSLEETARLATAFSIHSLTRQPGSLDLLTALPSLLPAIQTQILPLIRE
jgi:1-phosphofructokinase